MLCSHTSQNSLIPIALFVLLNLAPDMIIGTIIGTTSLGLFFFPVVLVVWKYLGTVSGGGRILWINMTGSPQTYRVSKMRPSILKLPPAHSYTFWSLLILLMPASTHGVFVGNEYRTKVETWHVSHICQRTQGIRAAKGLIQSTLVKADAAEPLQEVVGNGFYFIYFYINRGALYKRKKTQNPSLVMSRLGGIVCYLGLLKDWSYGPQLLLQLQQLLSCRVQVPGLLHQMFLTDQIIKKKTKNMIMEDYDDEWEREKQSRVSDFVIILTGIIIMHESLLQGEALTWSPSVWQSPSSGLFYPPGVWWLRSSVWSWHLHSEEDQTG